LNLWTNPTSKIMYTLGTSAFAAANAVGAENDYNYFP
jgi:hypothetical protein